jgi:hypothetical protein
MRRFRTLLPSPRNGEVRPKADRWSPRPQLTCSRTNPLARVSAEPISPTDSAMHRVGVYRMVRRRTVKRLRVKTRLPCVSVAAAITPYLQAGGTFENALSCGGAREPSHNQAL